MSNPIQHKFAGAVDIGTLFLGGTQITASASDINSISGGTATGNKKYSNAAVAAAGTNQSTATAMTADLNIVSAADGTKGVKLMTAVDGYSVTVVNTSTTAVLKVYPATGGAINSLGANAAFSVGPDKQATFDATSTTQWYCQGDAARTATVAEQNVLAGVTAGTQAAGKAVVADANVNTGVSKVTELHIGATGAETQVNATGTQLNYLATLTPGTASATKAAVLDASKNISGLNVVGLSKVTLATASTLTALATGATIATVVASVQQIIAFAQAKLGAS